MNPAHAGLNLDAILDAIADRVAARLNGSPRSQGQPARRLLDLDRAAEYIGRTPRAVRALIAARAFPTVEADRRVFIDIRDLDHWIEANKV